MNIIRYFKCVACVILAVFILCSCAPSVESGNSGIQSQPQSDAASSNTICLPYSRRDSLNPYICETKQNLELSKLLFDPLIKLNESFEPELFIAQSHSYADKKCTVLLKNIKFTDGSNVSADDVVYSFKAAASSANYKKQLESMSATAIDSLTVQFSLQHTDPNMINLLDFPIIKAGSADLKDQNNRSIAPIGCGRYYFTDSNALELTANASYYNGNISAQSITLVDCPDNESLSHYTAAGTISMIYSDMSNNDVPKKAGDYVGTASTNLVFIGVNNSSSKLSDGRIRHSISSAVDRIQLCEQGYYGYAQAANNVFSPNLSLSNHIQSINVTQNINQTVAYLELIGYNELDSDGFRIDSNGNRLSFTLMYNTDNVARDAAAKLIALQLNKCGIEIILNGVTYDEYKQNLSNGSFELYIGEIKLSKSFYMMDILSSEVVAGYPKQSQDSTAASEITSESEGTEAIDEGSAVAMFNKYYSGEAEIESALSAFAAQMPFIPLCYRTGVIVASNWLADSLKPSVSDIYNGIEGYK